jgi:hypothetical protein
MEEDFIGPPRKKMVHEYYDPVHVFHLTPRVRLEQSEPFTPVFRAHYYLVHPQSRVGRVSLNELAKYYCVDDSQRGPERMPFDVEHKHFGAPRHNYCPTKSLEPGVERWRGKPIGRDLKIDYWTKVYPWKVRANY